MVMLKYLKETKHFGDGDHQLLGFCHIWHLILNPIIFSCSSTSLLDFEPPCQHPSIAIFEHFCWFGDDVQFSFFTSISGISWRCKQRSGSLVNDMSNHYKAIFIIFFGCCFNYFSNCIRWKILFQIQIIRASSYCILLWIKQTCDAPIWFFFYSFVCLDIYTLWSITSFVSLHFLLELRFWFGSLFLKVAFKIIVKGSLKIFLN
jgi:hypothetical protein